MAGSLISVDEAWRRIAQHARPLPSAPMPLRTCVGRWLAEDVVADIDSPPYDKAMVDGYAVRSEDFLRAARGEAAEPVEMAVVEEVFAGAVPTVPANSGRCTRIMTGAPIPDGADAVVMHEQTSCAVEAGQPLGVVAFHEAQVRTGQNIQPRAASFSAGQVVLSAGRRLRAIECGLLAEVGRTAVQAVPAPRVAVLATGNELVGAEMRPSFGQIRNSNGPLLLAAVAEAGAVGVDLDMARDEETDLRRRIERGLEADVLLISGGVSAGVADLVPQVLAACGVQPVFHKLRIKPGKPLWFGVAGDPESPDCLVFGLPGNPVSSLVGFELFVRPALARLAGGAWRTPATRQVRLAAPFRHKGDRPTYFPSRWEPEVEESNDPIDAALPWATPLPWRGSSDLRTFTDAELLLAFPPGDAAYEPGALLPALPLGQWEK